VKKFSNNISSQELSLVSWDIYLKMHPDLRRHGINTEETAKKHWLNHGKQEGRLIFTKEFSRNRANFKEIINNLIKYDTQYQLSLRSKIINRIIRCCNYEKYLEIGVMRKQLNFNNIQIEHKIGVDPGGEGFSEATHTMTSDDYFKQNKESFDIVFIDGLHESRQVLNDILNALRFLNRGGTIVCHDMNPLLELCQRVPRQTAIWNGDGWKAFVTLRMQREDLEMYVIDADYGLGIIRRGSQEKLKKCKLTYKNLKKNRKVWLNLISEDAFFNSKLQGK